MPSFHVVDPARTNFHCILEIRPVLSKSELLGTLKNTLSLDLSQHIECIQFFTHPTSVESLGAFITFHSPGHAHLATEELRKHTLHSHVLGAQMVSAIQQPGYYLPSNLVLPDRPFSNFRVIIGSKPNDLGDENPSSSLESHTIHNDVLSSYNFSVLNVHGIIDQADLERVLRLRITIRIPIVCVQIWRARSSQSLHAYVTFLSRPHAQWAVTELHGRKETHAWTIRPVRNSGLHRCARPPTEQERVSARLSDAQNSSATGATALSVTRLAFSPTAVIIPFYATLLPPSPCEPHSPEETTHYSVPSRDCAAPQVVSYAPSDASTKLAMIQDGPHTPKRPRSCSAMVTTEVSDLRGDLALPQLRIDPGTPSNASTHTAGTINHAPPILRAHSQPVVSLFRPRECQTTINPLVASTVCASRIPHVETTLFAHRPIVEQDSSLDFSSDSISFSSKFSKDRQSRFDPFSESRATDVGEGTVDALKQLTLQGPHVPTPERPTQVSQNKPTPFVPAEETNTLSLGDRIKRRTWQFRPLNP